MLATGVNAITCYLHACRHQNESKSRKYLAKVIWLLTYDDDKCTLAEAVDKYNVGVPPLQWLPWLVLPLETFIINFCFLTLQCVYYLELQFTKDFFKFVITTSYMK